MAALFLAIPLHELTVGSLETAAIMLTDRGVMEWATGDAMGEQLAGWLYLVLPPGGRKAYLDCDPQEMGRLQTQAMREYRKRILSEGIST